MKYNFNEQVDRKNNHSAKWEEMKYKFVDNDLWPMWIADMDLKTAPSIIEEMKLKVEQGIFGYVYRPDSYYQSAANWSEERFNYKINPQTLICSPGVVPTLSILVRLMTDIGDKILIQSPVYYPFSSVVTENERILIDSPLKKDINGYYHIDFIDMESKLAANNIKLFIFCSPHNPVGRVWTREELEKTCELCLKYNVKIISDEIWRDLVLPGNVHIPLASLSKNSEKNTITCFSPTKTFNIAGLQSSFVTFPVKKEWENFDKELSLLDIKRNNPFSLVAFEAAYTKCTDWLEELLIHLDGNIEYVSNFLKEKLPEVKLVKPEATYLLWLDFSSLNFSKEELSKLMQIEGKIALDDGFWFGENGSGYERMNIATPRYMVEEGMKRIEKAVKTTRNLSNIKEL